MGLTGEDATDWPLTLTVNWGADEGGVHTSAGGYSMGTLTSCTPITSSPRDCSVVPHLQVLRLESAAQGRVFKLSHVYSTIGLKDVSLVVKDADGSTQFVVLRFDV